MKKMPPDSLSSDEILIAEFEYIAQTAIQTNEDRARVASFYLVSVGSIIAAILTTQVDSLQAGGIYVAFGALFLLLTLAGLLTLLQLVRLRLAWRESVTAMNAIKQYYTESIQNNLENAFLWSDANLPPAYKPGSVSHLLAVQVSILDAVVLAAAAFYFGLAASFGQPATWVASLAMFAVGLIGSLRLYKKQILRKAAP